MPELPEVETIRRGLQDLIVGYKIVGIESDSPKQVQPSLGLVRAAIQGGTLIRVNRKAKIILMFLDNGKILAVHLKLTGRLLVRKAGTPKDEWQHVTIKLTDSGQARITKKIHDLELRFCDARKFGWIKLLSSLSHLSDLGTYGPEPLTPEFTLEKFKEILTTNSRPVKVILMDQEKIAGIGNIYANDALFLAKIDPRRPAKSLKLSECKSLRETIIKVLKLGLKYGGASDQYYLNAKGEKGFYQEHFLVYGKKGKPCPNQCGGLIKRIVVGGRGTFICPNCQK